MNSPFLNGSSWLRTDFHLHTKADKEFQYAPKEGEAASIGNFVKAYIQKIEDNGISIAAITNHNKFDLEEFKSLKKRGKKSGILLLAGVELSVNDGANGIHCLIIFHISMKTK